MKGYIFDLDGTVYLGESIIEGAAEAIRALRERGDKVIFLSNKPIATRSSYAGKLTKMGIPTPIEDVLNSSLILARYLQQNVKQGQRVYVVGEAPIREELRQHGIAITDDGLQSDYVVLSWDRGFNYAALNVVYQAVLRGAAVIASNPDTTCPLEDGTLPDTGTFIAALEAATGKPIDLIVGKPSPIAAAAAVDHIGIEARDCYMIGDRLETDILMGNEAGMSSVLVLTGVSTREMALQAPSRPKHILLSIREIVDL